MINFKLFRLMIIIQLIAIFVFSFFYIITNKYIENLSLSLKQVETKQDLLLIDNNINKDIIRIRAFNKKTAESIIQDFCEKAYNYNISLKELKSKKECVEYYVKKDENKEQNIDKNIVENKEINTDKVNIDTEVQNEDNLNVNENK